jgi:hypothetical protein
MRRMNLAVVLLLVVGVALVGVVSPVVAAQKGAGGGGAPKPDGKVRMITTSISPNMGVSWADGQLSYNNQDYKFTVEAKTYTESDVLRGLAGQGSSTVKRGHEHHRSMRRFSVREGRPRGVGGVQRGGGT